LYEKVCNRQIEELKEFVRFEDFVDVLDFAFAPGGTKSVTVFKHNTGPGVRASAAYDSYSTATAAEINRNPLRYYQAAVFNYIVYQVGAQLKNLRLVSKNWDGKITEKEDSDDFKIIPVLQLKTLIQALYFQFYMLLNDRNKKLCACCGRVFTPSRPDARYCSDKCKQREKMRRRRERKKGRS